MARPREFDHEKVLNKMTTLFWEKGFKGTSMDDLVNQTGLNKGSLYTCFGNKEEIFKVALNHYVSLRQKEFPKKESSIETLREFYRTLINQAKRSKKDRRGCFVFNSCLEFGSQAGRLSPFVLSLGKKCEEFFHDLIEEAQRSGEIPKRIDKKMAAQRAFATAFTIIEMTKFKPDVEFLCDVVNTFLNSIGTKQKIKVSAHL